MTSACGLEETTIDPNEITIRISTLDLNAMPSTSSPSLPSYTTPASNGEVSEPTAPAQPRLPFELIRKIIAYIEYPPSLASCALVSKSIHSIAISRLYTSISLSHAEAIIAFVTQVPKEKKKLVQRAYFAFVPEYYSTIENTSTLQT
ncbi:hypothetical protein I317_00171 [Kwoniella heveanensis CBS 569]|nr:hypothetical protein I317_00171 [Kwoniella heveanensis CBS 569]